MRNGTRVPYPCRPWARAGMDCPPGYHELLEEEDDDDDDDDDDDPQGPGRNAAVGRRIRRLTPPNATSAQQALVLSQVFDEVQRILDRGRKVSAQAWAQFDPPRVVPKLVTPTRSNKDWKKEVATAAVIVLAGFAAYRALSVTGRRMAPGTAILGAAGIIAPFLAGLEQEPRTLSLVPAYAYAEYREIRRRRLEEEQASKSASENIFEEPPGGGATGPNSHYIWWTPERGFEVLLIRVQGIAYHYQGTLDEMTDIMNRNIAGNVGDQGFNSFIQGLIERAQKECGCLDPLGGLDGSLPGSEIQQGGAGDEVIDESTPVGNTW